MQHLTSIELLEKLREGLVQFFDELITVVPEEHSFVVYRFIIKEQVPIQDVMLYIIKNLVPLEPRVIARDDTYFKQHAVLFERMQDHSSQANHFKKLWESTDDEESKEAVWNWLHYFILLGKSFHSR